MTKANKKSSRHDQPTLFDYLREQRQATVRPKGSLNIKAETKAALAEDLRHAVDEQGKELSRAEVAARMTDHIGDEVTLTMINNWTATSHPHEMPLSHLPAFTEATGNQRRTVEVLSRHTGLYLLPGPQALRAETQSLRERRKKIDREIRARETLIEQMEGK